MLLLLPLLLLLRSASLWCYLQPLLLLGAPADAPTRCQDFSPLLTLADAAAIPLSAALSLYPLLLPSVRCCSSWCSCCCFVVLRGSSCCYCIR
jgi:hypothetical protein